MPEGTAELLPELLPPGISLSFPQRNPFPRSLWPQLGDESCSQEGCAHQGAHLSHPAGGWQLLLLGFLHLREAGLHPGHAARVTALLNNTGRDLGNVAVRQQGLTPGTPLPRDGNGETGLTRPPTQAVSPAAH